MKDIHKTKKQLIDELKDLRHRMAALETFETEHLQTKEDLGLFKLLVESSQEAIAISDPNGKLVYINPAHTKLFGRGLKEAQKINYRDYYPQKSIEIIDQEVAPALARGDKWEGVLDVLDAKGRRFPLWESADTVRDSDGKMIYGFGLMHDASKEMEAEKVVQTAHDELEKRVKDRTRKLEKSNRKLGQEIEQRKQMEKVLRGVAQGVSAKTGEAFLRFLVQYLSKMLKVNYAFVGTLANEINEKIETVAVCSHGKIIDNFKYDLAQTPCEKVVGRTLCSYPFGVQQQFPEDHLLEEMDAESYIGTPLFDSKGLPLGIMAILDSGPLKNPETMESMLQIFAFRAAAELERLRMERRIQDSEERYRSLVELSPDIIAVHCEGKIVYINRSGAKLAGATDPEQLIGKPIMDFLHPDYRDIVKERMQKILHENSDVPLIEEKLITLDGTVIDVESAAIPFKYQGKPAIQFIAHDITERKRAEGELRDSEKLYRMLVETMNDSLGIIDDSGRVTYVNDKLCQMLGYSREELLRRPLSDLMDSANQNIFNLQMKHRKKGKRKSYELTWTRKDGVKVPTINAPQPIYDPAGNFRGSFAIITDISEIKHTEMKLKKSKASLSDAQRIAHLGNWNWDIVNNEVYWSDEIYRIIGLSQKEFGATFEACMGCVHPQDIKLVKRAVNAALYGKKPYSIDHRIVMPDGSERIIHGEAEVSFDQYGKPVQMIGTIQDITESKRVIRTLETYAKQQAVIAEVGRSALSSQDITQLMDQIVDLVAGCLEVDYCKVLELLPDGNALLLRAGVGWEKGLVGNVTVGAKTNSQAGYTLLSNQPVIVEDLRTETRFSGPQLLIDHHVVSGMSVIIHGQNRSFGVLSVHTTYHRSFTEDEVGFFQSVANMLAVVMNRKLAEEQLQKSRTMLHTVFEGISEPLIMMDRDLSILMLNKAAKEHYQITENEEILGKCCFQALKGRRDPCAECNIPSAVLSGEPRIFEQKGFWHSGSEKVYQVAIYPLFEDKDTKPGCIIRISDITKLRQRERQLMMSEKLASLGLLVSGIAHEINNPNSFITFNIPILREYLKEVIPIIDDYAAAHDNLEISKMPYTEFREDIFKLLDNMEHGSQRINGIISGLREFVGNRPQRNRKVINLKKLIDRVLAICQGKVKKTVKSFDVDIAEKIDPIFTNPDAIEQILINLLINASQAMDKEDSWVKVCVTQGNTWRDWTIVEVSDNGCGMDKETQKSIFDPFITSKAPEGTGLGLYVCHNLIEGLGGRIEVESKLGKGSTFRVILPDKERRKNKRC